MKNKKILLALFFIVVLVQICIGLKSAFGGIDILQSGQLVKLKWSIGNIGSWNYRNLIIRESVNSFHLPYNSDIVFVEKEIKKAKKKKDYPENIFLWDDKSKFYIGFKEGKDGIYFPEAYATKPDNFDIYFKTTPSICILIKYENKKKVLLPTPKIAFNSMSIKLSYSEKQLKKIAGYVNNIPGEKCNAVGVFRYRDGTFLPVDIIVNGKSLNEIAGKKNFEK